MILPLVDFRVWSGFALMALTSVSSSAMIPSTIEGAPPRAATKPVEETSLPAEAEMAAPPMQFDLDCEVTVRLMANPGGHRPGRSSFLPFDYVDRPRFVVDLHAMRYCPVEMCASHGRFRIRSWDAYRIVLVDHFGGGSLVSDVWIHSVVHRYETTYESRRTGNDGFMLRSAGRCRYEPFSGFPTERDNPGSAI